MRTIELSNKWNNKFKSFVNQDTLDFYYFIYDFSEHRCTSKFYMAVDESDEIHALALNYDDRIVQLRGTKNAICFLLDNNRFGKACYQIPIDYARFVMERLSTHNLSIATQTTLMYLKDELKVIKPTALVINLKHEASEEISVLLKQTNLMLWNGSAQEVRARFTDYSWFGIRENGKLVSFAAARLKDYGAMIGPVITDESYRNRGYATTIVSTIVRDALKIHITPIISVRNDNRPAIHVYSSIGLEPYKSYYVLTPKADIA